MKKKDFKKIKMILFDLDDTLIGSSEIYKKSILGLGINSKELEAAKKQVKCRMGDTHVSSHHRLLYFKAHLESKKIFSPETNLLMIQKYEKNLSLHIRRHWKALKRDQLLRKLKRNFRLAVVTNETTRTQLIKLAAFGKSSDLFEFVVTSEEMGVEKPDFKIFLECLRRSKLKPNQVLMVGDSVRCDLKPMKQIGAQVLGTKEFLKNGMDVDTNFFWLEQLHQLEKIIL